MGASYLINRALELLSETLFSPNQLLHGSPLTFPHLCDFLVMMGPSLLWEASSIQMNHFIPRPLERTVETHFLHILIFCILSRLLPSDICLHDSTEASVVRVPMTFTFPNPVVNLGPHRTLLLTVFDTVYLFYLTWPDTRFLAFFLTHRHALSFLC